MDGAFNSPEGMSRIPRCQLPNTALKRPSPPFGKPSFPEDGRHIAPESKTVFKNDVFLSPGRLPSSKEDCQYDKREEQAPSIAHSLEHHNREGKHDLPASSDGVHCPDKTRDTLHLLRNYRPFQEHRSSKNSERTTDSDITRNEYVHNIWLKQQEFMKTRAEDERFENQRATNFHRQPHGIDGIQKASATCPVHKDRQQRDNNIHCHDPLRVYSMPTQSHTVCSRYRVREICGVHEERVNEVTSMQSVYTHCNRRDLPLEDHYPNNRQVLARDGCIRTQRCYCRSCAQAEAAERKRIQWEMSRDLHREQIRNDRETPQHKDEIRREPVEIIVRDVDNQRHVSHHCHNQHCGSGHCKVDAERVRGAPDIINSVPVIVDCFSLANQKPETQSNIERMTPVSKLVAPPYPRDEEFCDNMRNRGARSWENGFETVNRPSRVPSQPSLHGCPYIRRHSTEDSFNAEISHDRAMFPLKRRFHSDSQIREEERSNEYRRHPYFTFQDYAQDHRVYNNARGNRLEYQNRVVNTTPVGEKGNLDFNREERVGIEDRHERIEAREESQMNHNRSPNFSVVRNSSAPPARRISLKRLSADGDDGDSTEKYLRELIAEKSGANRSVTEEEEPMRHSKIIQTEGAMQNVLLEGGKPNDLVQQHGDTTLVSVKVEQTDEITGETNARDEGSGDSTGAIASQDKEKIPFQAINGTANRNALSQENQEIGGPSEKEISHTSHSTYNGIGKKQFRPAEFPREQDVELGRKSIVEPSEDTGYGIPRCSGDTIGRLEQEKEHVEFAHVEHVDSRRAHGCNSIGNASPETENDGQFREEFVHVLQNTEDYPFQNHWGEGESPDKEGIDFGRSDQMKDPTRLKKQWERMCAIVQGYEKPKEYRCEFCGRAFSHLSSLNNHIRTHTGQKPFKCEFCHKRFAQSGVLTAHMRTHTGDKPFKCHICAREFAQTTTLSNHIRTHTGQKPFRCRSCFRAFAQSSTRNKHELSHTREKPYTCRYCNRSFTQSSTVMRHMRTHDKDTSYRCIHCGKVFAHLYSLDKHLDTHGRQEKDCENSP